MKMTEKGNLERELKGLESDRVQAEQALKAHRERYAKMIIGGLGEDIDAVLSGKRKVKLTFMEKVKYRTRRIIDTIFELF